MTVSELQTLLSDMAKFLRLSQASKPAGELEYFSANLAPFKNQTLKTFADFLKQAEESARGVAPEKKAARSKKSKATPEAIEQACNQVLHLYHQAIDPSTTLEQIELGVQNLQAVDPPKNRLLMLAQAMGITQNFSSKPAIIKAIRQKILGNKGSFDRTTA